MSTTAYKLEIQIYYYSFNHLRPFQVVSGGTRGTLPFVNFFMYPWGGRGFEMNPSLDSLNDPLVVKCIVPQFPYVSVWCVLYDVWSEKVHYIGVAAEGAKSLLRPNPDILTIVD